jgi:hypothetical protein
MTSKQGSAATRRENRCLGGAGEENDEYLPVDVIDPAEAAP